MAAFMHSMNEINNVNISDSSAVLLPFLSNESSETVLKRVSFKDNFGSLIDADYGTLTVRNAYFGTNEFDSTAYLLDLRNINASVQSTTFEDNKCENLCLTTLDTSISMSDSEFQRNVQRHSHLERGKDRH
ncbi:MAG: hypothetical protein GY938_22505 [Ketobacter sp.]|nr:hypothetical protein [Ketobacter sp.]